MAVYGLIDGNSFYCSCEQAFDPALRDKPVVVLSNNDGCVIARSAFYEECQLLSRPYTTSAHGHNCGRRAPAFSQTLAAWQSIRP